MLGLLRAWYWRLRGPDARLARTAHEGVGIKGRIGVETRWADSGALIPEESGWSDNVVVTVGKAQLAALLAQEAATTGYQIAVGTSGTAPTSGDTALGAEVHRALITSKTRSGAVVTYRLYVDTASANGHTLVEVGLFHNLVMLDHALVTSVAKNASKTVTYTVQLTVG